MRPPIVFLSSPKGPGPETDLFQTEPLPLFFENEIVRVSMAHGVYACVQPETSVVCAVDEKPRFLART